MTEPGETDDFSVLEHLLTIERHLGRAAVRLRDLQHHAGSRGAGGGVCASAGRLPIVTGTFELNALERLGVRADRRAAGVGAPRRQDPASPRAAGGGDHGAGAGQARRVARRAQRPEASDMYERFYQLRERPFALSPDPEYLYPSRVHQEALDYLRYGLESQAGFIVITGEIGSGKTTLLQTLLRSLDSADDGRAHRQHDARAARAARDDHDRLRPRSGAAGASRCCCATSRSTWSISGSRAGWCCW